MSDPATLLRARVGSGELTQAHVDLASHLGHVAAQAVSKPEPTLADEELWSSAVALLNDSQTRSLAADMGERFLSNLNDPRATVAIQAARMFVAGQATPDQLSHAVSMINEVYMERAVRLNASEFKLANARAVYWAAKGDATAVRNNTTPTGFSSAGALEAERRWQSLRLAAYLLGEVA